MDLRKLPTSMLLALGLVACGDDGSQESETGPCLSFDPTEQGSGSGTGTGTGSGTDIGSTGADGSSGSTTGGSSDTTFGPCLGPLPSTETGTETGPDTGSDSGSGSGTTGMDAQDAQDAAPTRAEAMARLLERGTLPADVAARLQKLGKKP